jgi:hypothetical protein
VFLLSPKLHHTVTYRGPVGARGRGVGSSANGKAQINVVRGGQLVRDAKSAFKFEPPHTHSESYAYHTHARLLLTNSGRGGKQEERRLKEGSLDVM